MLCVCSDSRIHGQDQRFALRSERATGRLTFGTLGGSLFFNLWRPALHHSPLPMPCSFFPAQPPPQRARMSHIQPVTWTWSPFFLSVVTPEHYIVLRKSKTCSWEDRGPGKGVSPFGGGANFLPSLWRAEQLLREHMSLGEKWGQVHSEVSIWLPGRLSLRVAWGLEKEDISVFFPNSSLCCLYSNVISCQRYLARRGNEGFSGKQLTGTKTSPLDNLTVWLASNRAICHVILTRTLCQTKLFLLSFRGRFQKKNLEGFVEFRCSRDYDRVRSFQMCFWSDSKSNGPLIKCFIQGCPRPSVGREGARQRGKPWKVWWFDAIAWSLDLG